MNFTVPQTLEAVVADRIVAEQPKRDKELQFPVHSNVKGFDMPVVFPSGKDKHIAHTKTKQTNPKPNQPTKNNPTKQTKKAKSSWQKFNLEGGK